MNIISPTLYPHLQNRKKQEQKREGNIELERFTEIERANRILLEKMSDIMNSKSPLRQSTTKRSLNKEMRKQFLAKIANDNMALLERIRCRTPFYSSKQWDKDWKTTEKRLQNLSEYPNMIQSKAVKVFSI